LKALAPASGLDLLSDEAFFTKSLTFRGTDYSVEMLDTTGLELFAAMKDSFIGNGDGFLLVFDVNSHTSFLSLRDEVSLLMKFREFAEIPLVVVGMVPRNTDHSAREVTQEAARVFARYLAATYLECPVDSASGAERVLVQIISRVEEVRDAAAQNKQRQQRSNEPASFKPSSLIKKVCRRLLRAV